MKLKRRFCQKEQDYCIFANRCSYCSYFVGLGCCDKRKSYICNPNDECFECDCCKITHKSYCKEMIEKTKSMIKNNYLK